jgi:alkylation response protein AidB-like acyl-CoA dehydrogenase
MGNAICGLAIHENSRIYEKPAIETTAIKEKDEWILNGEKTYVINGGKSTFFLVLCRNVATDGRSGGTNLILVEKNAPGLEIMELGEKMGLRMTPMAKIRLKSTKVPFSNMIGKIGQGDSIIDVVMNHNRIWLAGMALGTAQGAFDRALDYVKKRVQFGKKIVEFQVTRQKLAEMAIKIQQARDMTYSGAVSCGSRKPDGKLTAMAKLTACRAAVEVASEAIQLMGGYGYINEYEVERFFRDAKAMEILSENPMMLKDVIAGNIIGKI